MHMKTTTTFTSTIAPEIIKWVDEVAKAKKLTRRSVLEDAVKRYRHELTRQYLKEGFQRAANDPDIIELTEWGMGDYARMLDHFDA